MTIRITDSDIRHMNRFSPAKRALMMSTIMSLEPLSQEQRSESNYYEKTMIRLRKDGFSLIDLQPLETAMTMVWYRASGLRFGRARTDVKMVLWESQEAGDTTTVMTWKI